MRPWICLPIFATAVFFALVTPGVAEARDHDCPEFANQAEAQEYLVSGDPYRLDADNDGIACEDLPCPCSYGPTGPAEEPKPPAPPPPFRLTKSAARHAAAVVTRKSARRNAKVSSGSVGACRQLAERRIDCAATTRGHTGTDRTTCHLRIAVRAVNRKPQASLASVHCRTFITLRLTAAKAQAAIRARASELAGKRVAIIVLEREDPRQFTGITEWIQRNSLNEREECFASFDAVLQPSRDVAVSLIESGCDPALSP
jgi:hypothetical protein